MDIGRFHKKDIAKRQLQTALELFFAGGDLFSVVTLAAAAEEMLGALLRQKGGGGGGAFRSVLHLFASRRGEPASSGMLKESECYLHMDPRQEAVFLLGRCIDDYRALEGDATEEMFRFDREIRGKR
jgi:hypothetical protein